MFAMHNCTRNLQQYDKFSIEKMILGLWRYQNMQVNDVIEQIMFFDINILILIKSADFFLFWKNKLKQRCVIAKTLCAYQNRMFNG